MNQDVLCVLVNITYRLLFVFSYLVCTSEITDQIARVGFAVKNQISNTILSFYSGSSTQPEEEKKVQEEGRIINLKIHSNTFYS